MPAWPAAFIYVEIRADLPILQKELSGFWGHEELEGVTKTTKVTSLDKRGWSGYGQT
ncbi:hypothetical protein SBDP1_1500004 [Syntrophobacter sp. SbD1]|nr:hypothetical protein SBDP1_1500004 [Syntrophobacter sp. SbD1]